MSHNADRLESRKKLVLSMLFVWLYFVFFIFVVEGDIMVAVIIATLGTFVTLILVVAALRLSDLLRT